MIRSLKNVDVNAIQVLLDRSLRVNNSLMFEISGTEIKSSISNEDDNFWKQWSIPSNEIYESVEDFKPIKILFSNGGFFRKNFLGLYSGQKVDIDITVDEKNSATEFEVTGKTSFGTYLTTRLKATNYNLAKDPLGGEMQTKMFTSDTPQRVTQFDIEPNVWSEIGKLIGLSSMSDNPVAYIEFSGKDGKIEVSDTAFNFTMAEYDGEPFSAKFPKKSLSYLDDEPVTASLLVDPVQEYEWLIIESKHSSVESTCAAMLMKTLSEDNISDDIFGDSDSGW